MGKNNTRIGRTFLKFSLATLPPGTTASDVKQARLVLWVNNSTTNLGSITMTPVTSVWDELVLKNNNSLGLTFGSPKISNLPVASSSNFLSIDVTDWVKAWLNGTLTNEGFQIEPGASMTLLNLYFDSKESTLTSHQPRLEIVLNSAGPQGPAGPQGAAGPQGLQGLQGSAGPAGATGPTGLTGPAGPAGQTGAPGPQGVAGANGTKWFSWTGAPNENLGALYDYYLDLSTGDVWQKVSNEGGPVWAAQGSIRGAQGVTGATGPTGAQGPAGLVGAQGPAGPQGNIGPQGIGGPAGDIGPGGPEGPPGPAAVWPTQIQPQGDLSMGEFTQGQTP